MAFDLAMFADKLRRYCVQLEVDATKLAQGTGLPAPRIQKLFDGNAEPTGDEILILADFFRCDFKFFITNERLASFEQTEQLFRKHGDILKSEDRWAIQEFLFLCECQAFLLANTPGAIAPIPFAFTKTGAYYKQHGCDAALALRRHLKYVATAVPRDVFSDFRSIGIHMFRRKLNQSSISGVFIRHPVAGPCALINYNEDIYRQRFSAAHEAAHAILDDGEDYSVSFSKWDKDNLSEIRANAFASNYLMPPEFLSAIPSDVRWSPENCLAWANKLRVNPESLAHSLKKMALINDSQHAQLKNLKIPREAKIDPELPDSLAVEPRRRKVELLERGLSDSYVNLCFDAHNREVISIGRLAEMLLCEPGELPALATLFGRSLRHDN